MRTVRLVLSGLTMAILAAGVGAGTAKADAPKLKLATAAAPDSAWGQVFKTWDMAVKTKTGWEKDDKGKFLPTSKTGVGFDFFYNSSMGSEATAVDKMKAGQLDGAAVTSTGLGRIDKRLLLMQMPGTVRSWKAVDAVRAQMGEQFEGFLKEKKIVQITPGDVGYAHFLSKGFQVKTPDDLKGKNPWINPSDPILPVVYNKIGGVNPFPSELMSVLPNIDNNKINCLSISALAAEMLQWNSKFDNAVDSVNAIVVGAVIMSSDSLDKLPADQKAAVIDTGRAMGSSAAGLKARIRAEDGAAWDRFKARSGVKLYKPDAGEEGKWATVFKAARDSLKMGTFDPALVSKIETIAAANP